MKVVLLFIGVVIGTSGYGQLPVKDGSVFYEQIDTLPGVTKDEVYKRAKEWLVHAFKDAQEVIQLDNKEDGEIIGKGSLDCTYSYIGVGILCYSRFTIKLTARDGKHRIQIYDFSARRPERNRQTVDFEDLVKRPNTAENKRMITKIDGQIQEMLTTLRFTLLKQKKDDF